MLCAGPEPLKNCKIRQRIEASFSVMAPQLFNSLPSEIRDFQGSMNGFKVKLDRFSRKFLTSQFYADAITQYPISGKLVKSLPS